MTHYIRPFGVYLVVVVCALVGMGCEFLGQGMYFAGKGLMRAADWVRDFGELLLDQMELEGLR